MFIDRSETADLGLWDDWDACFAIYIIGNTCVVSFVPKHRVRDARVRKRRREEHTRRALHHSLPEHRLFRSIERQTSSTRVAKTQISRKRCPFPVSRDVDFFAFFVASFREEKKYDNSPSRATSRDRAKSTEKCTEQVATKLDARRRIFVALFTSVRASPCLSPRHFLEYLLKP